MNKVFVIGECNPYGGSDANALVDHPPGCAGDRLRRIVFGVTEKTYYSEVFVRHNLCRGDWSLKKAREAARILLLASDTPFILLGRKVASAFFAQKSNLIPPYSARGRLISIPHPSGLCRDWGKRENVDRARDLLKRMLPDIPWGELDEEAE